MTRRADGPKSDAVEVTLRSGADAELAAAGIWARATAVRDGLPEVATAESKLAGIRQSLRREGATIHLASQRGLTCGFALVVPRGATLEIVYLATEPDGWGHGAGRALLDHVRSVARDAGHGIVELWVIVDNARAIRTYERAGWTDTGEVAVRNGAGRLERRYVAHLTRERTSS